MPNFVVGAPADSNFWEALEQAQLEIRPFKGQSNENIVLVEVNSERDTNFLKQIMRDHPDAKGPFQPLSEELRRANIQFLNSTDRKNLEDIEEIGRFN